MLNDSLSLAHRGSSALQTVRRALQGAPVAGGVAVGRVFHYQDVFSREMEVTDIKQSQIRSEWKRLHRAIQTVENDLTKMKLTIQKQVGSDQADIFEAHRLILRDVTLLKEIEEELNRRRVNIEHVVCEVFRRWERKLRDSPSADTRERSSDVADIGRRLLKELLGVRGGFLTRLRPGTVIFAKRLLPSDTVHIDRQNAIGIVTEEGGPNSHAAILARAFHIPLVSGIQINSRAITDGMQVILDGDKGLVILGASEKEMTSVKNLRSLAHRRDQALARALRRIRIEYKNASIRVDANVSSEEECRIAGSYGCDGIGLYRIEQLYMSSSVMPTENHLQEAIGRSLRRLKGQEATLRLLDIGGDKTLPYINLVERTNPALGVRGVRLLLKYPNLLQAQLRVFLRLSTQFKIRLLVPMVTLAQDMQLVRKTLDEEAEKLKGEIRGIAGLKLGAMIETPAAVLGIDPILQISDFVSIGTNDLLQYAMAADRENMSVADYYEAGNDLILGWVRLVAEKARRAGKDCEVCGELAANPKYVQALMESGIRHLSVTAHRIPRLKELIRNLNQSKPLSARAAGMR